LAPGNRRRGATRRAGLPRAEGAARGFTLIELMIVVALIAVAAGVVSLALRDPSSTRLQVEAQRLSALLESARAESRASGMAVHWVPSDVGDDVNFRFLRVSGNRSTTMAGPTRWLDPQVRAEVVDAPAVQLGPEPLIGAQRIVLRLADQRVALATDGLGPFAVVDDDTKP
jgi:general secretion pathway protein H